MNQLCIEAARLLGVPVEEVRLNTLETRSITGRHKIDHCIERLVDGQWCPVAGNNFNHAMALEELRRRVRQEQEIREAVAQ